MSQSGPNDNVPLSTPAEAPVAQPAAEVEAPEVAVTQELTAAPEVAETPAVDPGRPKRYKK